MAVGVISKPFLPAVEGVMIRPRRDGDSPRERGVADFSEDERVADGKRCPDGWQSRLGVIMAVAGSAVGLGNFLRFPGQAVQNGGGAFLIPYFTALLLLGIPLAWAEWTMGRYGGLRGFNSAPGIFAVVCRNPAARYLGTLGLLIPLVIYMYYVFIEAWCLGYAWNYLTGDLMKGPDPKAYADFFDSYVGTKEDGLLLGSTSGELLSILVLTFAMNFFLIYRGVGKGIETFCKYAMPLMAVCAVCVLVRVLTLGTPEPSQPGRSTLGGLAFMWEPNFEALKNPQTWIAAAGQIFFSLSVGFGIVINYSSYLTRKDDVALSSVTACTTNEFFEVCLGGMITLPAAFIFLGASIGTMGTFGLGFNALPNVFAQMPAGRVFGFLWFFMLFLAAITSSISMLQPVIAFLEEGFGLKRHASATLLGLITAIGTGFVVYFSKGMVALDTMDFWVGTVGIFVLGLVMSVVYGWVFGIDRGDAALHEGAHIRVPRFVQYVIKFVAPLYLGAIFVAFCVQNVPGYVKSIAENRVAAITILFMFTVFVFLGLLVHIAGRRWEREGRFGVPRPSADLEGDSR